MVNGEIKYVYCTYILHIYVPLQLVCKLQNEFA